MKWKVREISIDEFGNFFVLSFRGKGLKFRAKSLFVGRFDAVTGEFVLSSSCDTQRSFVKYLTEKFGKPKEDKTYAG